MTSFIFNGSKCIAIFIILLKAVNCGSDKCLLDYIFDKMLPPEESTALQLVQTPTPEKPEMCWVVVEDVMKEEDILEEFVVQNTSLVTGAALYWLMTLIIGTAIIIIIYKFRCVSNELPLMSDTDNIEVQQGTPGQVQSVPRVADTVFLHLQKLTKNLKDSGMSDVDKYLTNDFIQKIAGFIEERDAKKRDYLTQFTPDYLLELGKFNHHYQPQLLGGDNRTVVHLIVKEKVVSRVTDIVAVPEH